MTGSKIRFNLITFVFVAVVIFGIYYFFFRAEAEPTPGLTPAGFSSASGKGGELEVLAQSNDEFLQLLEGLEGIELKSDIFSNDVFNRRLTDSSFELESEPSGRPNPFAPL